MKREEEEKKEGEGKKILKQISLFISAAFLSRHYRPEAITIVRRLELLSAAQHSLFCPSLIPLLPKLINVYLDSNISKQKPILNFFKPSECELGNGC